MSHFVFITSTLYDMKTNRYVFNMHVVVMDFNIAHSDHLHRTFCNVALIT